jgi:HEAT repeat protein
MTTIGTKLTAVAFVLLTAAPAFAGKGGSALLISQAVQSRSTDAIIAEVEKTESLICNECIQLVTNLTEDNRYAVREVAAWWFAKRPQLQEAMAASFQSDLTSSDSIRVRNAADFLGVTKTYTSLPALRTAIHHGGLTSEAKLALVHAAGVMAHVSGNEVLTTAMTDGDPAVRAAAIVAWRDVLSQQGAGPVVALLHDSNAEVRMKAATTVGGMNEVNAHTTLEAMVVTDVDPSVRRAAAWALGQLGQADSRQALITASSDKSGLVSGVAKASLSLLH